MKQLNRKVSGWIVKVELYPSGTFAFRITNDHQGGEFTIFRHDGKPPSSLDIFETAQKWVKVSLPLSVTTKAATMCDVLFHQEILK